MRNVLLGEFTAILYRHCSVLYHRFLLLQYIQVYNVCMYIGMYTIGAAAHWSSSGVKWVIALDETCGPVLPGVTFTNGRPLVSIPSDAVNLQDIVYNQDYYSIKHMSRYLMQGHVPMKAEIHDYIQEIYEGTSNTVRVNTITSYNNSTTLFESFYNNTSSTITSIILNTDHENDITIKVTQGQLSFTDIVPKFGTKIYQWTRE